MTALRSCALCSASGSTPIVVAIAIWLPSPFPRCRGAGFWSPGLPQPRYVRPAPMAIDQRSSAAPQAGRGRFGAFCSAEFGTLPALLARPVRRHHGDRRVAILIGKQPLQIEEFRLVVDEEVRIGGVKYQKVLVIVLGG